MRVGHGVEVSYNVQIAVDQKNKLLVEHEVTNEVIDLGQLSTRAWAERPENRFYRRGSERSDRFATCPRHHSPHSLPRSGRSSDGAFD